MASLPPMASTSSYYLTYFKTLAKVRLIRLIHVVSVSLGRWRGSLPSSSLRPFESILLPSTKSSRRIRVNAYRTKAAMVHNVGPVAVHLNWHGSGWVLYAFGASVPMISHLVSHPVLENYPVVVLDCDYAKSPEYPYPAATDDARDVLEYVFAHPEVYDLNRVTLGGSSAGGNIAMGVSVAVGKEAREGKILRERSTGHSAEHPIEGLIVFYPPTEYDSRPDMTPSPGVNPPGMSLPKSLSDTFDTAYFFPSRPLSAAEDAKRKQDQLQMPLIAPRWADIRDFPKIIGLVTCEYDPLTAETENLRAELVKDGSGKNVSGWLVKGVAHGWDNLVLPGQPGYEERQRAYDLLAELIARSGGIAVSH